MQVPAWHLSLTVQTFPSLQGVPFTFGKSEHTPVVGLQPTALLHWSPVQTTCVPAVHDPDWHLSAVVHRLPSLQGVLLGASGFEQPPLAGLHVPATWH